MDKSASILIVDDYLLIRSPVRQVLTELGFINIFQAENGKTAQDLMRKDSRYARTPYMMLTAESNPASVRSALQAGVTAYMIKPFTVHSFASKFMAMIGSPQEAAPSPFPRVAARPVPAPAPARLPQPLRRHSARPVPAT
jgi:CheY-like chemotaxis protein